MILNEAFDSPVEFHLTDDTRLPARIFAAYNYENQDYGMSLEETSFPKVYALQLYKINSKKPRIWAFKGVRDIMVGFATLLKFAEMATPLVKMKMDGIMIRIPAKYAASKYQKFAERLLRKTYIKSFTIVPVDQSADQDAGYNYIFLIRKGASVGSVFKSKQFAKYNLKDNHPTSESLDAVEHKYPQKQIVKTDPSKKYTLTDPKLARLGDITVDHDEQELVAKAANAPTREILLDPKEEKFAFSSKQQELLRGFSGYYGRRYMGVWLVNKIFGSINSSKMSSIYNSGYSSEQYYKLVKDSLDSKTFNTVSGLLAARAKISEHTIEQIGHQFKMAMKLAYELYHMESSVDHSILDRAKDYMSVYEDHPEEATKYIHDYIDGIGSDGGHEKEIHKIAEGVDIPEVTLPGTGKFQHDHVFEKDIYAPLEYEEDVHTKIKYLEDQDKLGYYFKVKNLPGIAAIRNYTGSAYSDMNAYLRGLTLDKPDDFYNFKKSSVTSMAKAFDKIEPLSEGIWVYRATYVSDEIPIDVPGEFIDPAFLSTSIKSSNRYGWGNTLMQIYLPKGSRVIPVLNNSKNSGEAEVILPPFSVLRNVEVVHFKEKNGSKAKFVKQIFVGSAYKSFQNMQKKEVKEDWNIMEAIKNSAKPEPKYDPNKKFGSVNDPETFKKLTELLKSGKLKVTK